MRDTRVENQANLLPDWGSIYEGTHIVQIQKEIILGRVKDYFKDLKRKESGCLFPNRRDNSRIGCQDYGREQ